MGDVVDRREQASALATATAMKRVVFSVAVTLFVVSERMIEHTRRDAAILIATSCREDLRPKRTDPIR